MKSIHKDPNRVLFPDLGNGLASSLGSHSTGGGAAASLLSKKRLTLPFLVLIAALAVGVLFLLPGGLLQAQESSTIEYAENGTDPVATFTATDPEGAMPITWSLATGTQISAEADLDDADNADAEDFMIDKDGMLKFDIDAAQDGSSPGSPDFENGQGAVTSEANTYRVVVAATDPEATPQTGYHKVIVKVTNVEETGKVSWTVDPDGGEALTVEGVNGGMPIMQFQVGATLNVPPTGGVTDGDVSGPTKDVPERLQWYRSSSMTGMGTAIEDATEASYTVTTDDIGMYIRVDAFYNVDTGREESASLTSDYPVLGSRTSNDAPEFSPASVTREVSEGMKGMTVGAPVTATDDITNALNYVLSTDATNSPDNAKFEIDQKTGQITTAVDLNREQTTDADPAFGCGADYECTVQVIATDSAGAASDPVATVTITLENVDEKPTFTERAEGETTGTASPTAITVPENSTVLYGTAGDGYGFDTEDDVTYEATDPDGRSLTYNLMGADRAKFQLTAARALSFKAKPDYEMPSDANKDNVYEVTVQASDGTMYADRMVMVTVTDRDEAPDVSGPSSMNFAENRADPVATFMATDPEGATAITWSIPTGDPDDTGSLTADDNADSADFMIDPEDGVLKFSIDAAQDGSSPGSPDFENPQGAGTPANNTYNVVVAAADSTETDAQTGYHKITVKVTNVAETGKITWETAADGSTDDDPTLVQFQVGSRLTATAMDGDIEGATKNFTDSTATGVSAVTWQWFRGNTRITDSDADDNTYTVTTDDVRSRIRVMAFYTVGTGREESASLTSDYPVLGSRTSNDAPEFSPASVTREVSEGDKGMNVGAPVTATDDITNALNYALGTTTDDGIFEIDQKTGQITTRFDLNREADADATATAAGACSATTGTPASRMTCVVTVTATDSAGLDSTAAATVTINITNVDEKPEFTSGYEMASIMEGTTVVDTDADGDGDSTTGESAYAATDEDGLNVNLTLMGTDEARFSLSSDGVLSFRMKPDYEMPTDANGDNKYEVTVRASDGTMYADRMVTITVTDMNEPPVIMEGGLTMDGMSAVSVDENTIDVGTYMVAGPEAASATWTLEGADMGDFSIQGSGMSAMLRFSASPDYETPADANGDNVYMVTVKATDSEGNMATMRVTVTVNDVTNEQQSLAQRYDSPSNGGNGDGVLDLEEVYAAVDDYFDNNALTLEQVYELVDLYFDQG